jgi:hypothetical protein
MPHERKLTIDEAIAVLRRLDSRSTARLSTDERSAIVTLGTAGWSGDIEPTDPRLASLSPQIAEQIADVIRVMQTKRIVQ